MVNYCRENATDGTFLNINLYILQKARDACEYNAESEDCQKDLKLAANVVFKITPDAFKSGSIGFPSVPEDQAVFDRENGTRI